VLKLKYLTRFSLIAFIALMAVAAPLKLRAQDDVGGDDEGSIMPPMSNGSNPVPPPIDESDSNNVSDVEEYDG
jgi:hypothetical protein